MGYFSDSTAEELLQPLANRLHVVTDIGEDRRHRPYSVQVVRPNQELDLDSKLGRANATERNEKMTQHQRARSVIRGGMEDAVRTALLEDDVDTLVELISRTNRKLDRLLVTGISASLSFSVAAILFALNLVING